MPLYFPPGGGGGGGGATPDTVVSVAYAASITPDLSAGNVFRIATLTGPMTINAPSGTLTDAKKIYFQLVQDATGGRVVTWNSVFRFGFDIGSADFSTSPLAEIRVAFIYNTSNSKWEFAGFSRMA
jgi:hypothetical protein